MSGVEQLDDIHDHVHGDDGLVVDDPTRLSVAHLPYELQVMVFEAASQIQILFVVMNDNSMTLSEPVQFGLAASCRMARRLYIRNKVRVLDRYWVDPTRDIFYLRDETTPTRFRVCAYLPYSNCIRCDPGEDVVGQPP